MLGPSARARALALAGTLAVTVAVLLGDVWDTTQVREIRGHAAFAVVLVALAAAVVAAGAGARVVRVHDVAATRKALAVSDAVARSARTSG